jgi:hypothetical protein
MCLYHRLGIVTDNMHMMKETHFMGLHIIFSLFLALFLPLCVHVSICIVKM